jgi:hypothetical protein
MPNLTDPQIFPAVLGVGAVLASLLVNTIFTLIHKKIDFNNKRFFDAYNRRLAVYEEVIAGLDAMLKKHDSKTIIQLSAIDMSQIIIDSLHTLDILKARLMLYGSLAPAALLKVLADSIAPIQDQALNMVLQTPGVLTIKDVYIFYFRCVETAHQQFILLVSEETGKNLVDKKITKKTKKVFKKLTNWAKGMQGQDNKVGDNLKGNKPNPD